MIDPDPTINFTLTAASFPAGSAIALPKLERDVTAVYPDCRRRDKAQFHRLLLGIDQCLPDQNLYTSCSRDTPDRVERSRQVRVCAFATCTRFKVDKHEVDFDRLRLVFLSGCRHLGFPFRPLCVQPSFR